MTSRCQGLLLPQPFFKGKVLGTRLPKVRIRSQGTVKKDSLIKKLLEKNMRSNVNILVFWANIEQRFRNFQYFLFN